MKKWLKDYHSSLFTPVHGSTLALFRILFGVIMGAQAFNKYMDYVPYAFAPDRFHFTYPFADWIHPWGGDGMYVHIIVMGIAGICIGLGLFYRISSLVFAFCYTMIFLIDKTNYNNHYYLISMLAWIMIFLDANAVASMDNVIRKGGKKARILALIFGNVFFLINEFMEKNLRKWKPSVNIPKWNLFILQAMFFIVYFYGGLAKLNPDWLQGEPARQWYIDRSDALFIGSFFREAWFPYFIAYGGLLFDLSAGFLLIFSKTRKLILVPIFLFHLFNHWQMNIGIFPFTMMGATILFFPPDTVLRWFGGKAPEPLEENRIRLKRRTYIRRVTFMIGPFLAFQLLFPFRHYLIPGNVSWTEEGHQFSWHMKLRDKEGIIFWKVKNPATGEVIHISPGDELYGRQARKLASRPQMTWQYAQHLAQSFEQQGMKDPEVYVESLASLNGRPYQWLIDPRVNLAKVEYKVWSHNEWILQLPAGLPIGIYPKKPKRSEFPPLPSLSK